MMSNSYSRFFFTVVAATLLASSASAHITLKGKEATIGTPYEAVFAVPHGCAGSATIKVRVQIPEGVIAQKPAPKAGWNVETVTGKYAASYDDHGTNVSEGITEVAWSGGKLVDHHYEEFVIPTFLTGALKPNTTLYFPTVQECEQGVSRWIDIPTDPAHPHDSKWPAPGVKLLAKP
jgi:periplasmic copper chaperone A